jgi:hypothetical protein
MHAVPTNGPTLTAFRFHVTNLWRRTLRRRSQKDWTTKERTALLANDGSHDREILHPARCALCSQTTQGGSRMPESGPYGWGHKVTSVPTRHPMNAPAPMVLPALPTVKEAGTAALA